MASALELLLAARMLAPSGFTYGYADTNTTTVTAATAENLSTLYTIPAYEPLAGSCYELACGGSGTWGSTQQILKLTPELAGTSFGGGSTGQVAATAFSASAGFVWTARMRLTCTDGVSGWQVRFDAVLMQTAFAALPGTAADNVVPVCFYHSHTQAVSSAVTVALDAAWAATTGAPTITCNMTEFRKIA